MNHSVLIVVVMIVTTWLIRFLPFMVFARGQNIPDYVSFLGKVLPQAVMGMLVVYCLRDMTVSSLSSGVGGGGGGGGVVGLQLWKSNPIISIFGGTILYMIIVQVFLP